jgi:hypothetical protein
VLKICILVLNTLLKYATVTACAPRSCWVQSPLLDLKTMIFVFQPLSAAYLNSLAASSVLRGWKLRAIVSVTCTARVRSRAMEKRIAREAIRRFASITPRLPGCCSRVVALALCRRSGSNWNGSRALVPGAGARRQEEFSKRCRVSCLRVDCKPVEKLARLCHVFLSVPLLFPLSIPLRLRRAGRDKPKRRKRALTRSHATNVSDTLSDTLLLERRIEDAPEKIALALR